MVAKRHSIEWWKGLEPQKVGDEVEKLVEAVLKEMNRKTNFAWARLPDTKAARVNMIAPQPADYMYRRGAHAGFIEVKGIEHPYRLPSANFSQLPILHKWELAGSDDVLLVHHYLFGDWRAIDPRLLQTGVPSHDLREFNVYKTPRDALVSMRYFQ